MDFIPHLAVDHTEYLEKPALHPAQTTNDDEIHRMKSTSFLNNILYGDGGLINMHNTKIMGGFIGAAFALYTKRRPLWPYIALGFMAGWIIQSKCNDDCY
jgi:hypothetical protein